MLTSKDKDKSLINYSIYDQAGNGYIVKVTAAAARALYYDSKKEYRLVQSLHAQGLKPDYVKNQPKAQAKVPEAAGSSHQTTGNAVVRAVGKKGAEWTKVHTVILLTVLRPFQETLRKKQISLAFWKSISDELWEKGLNYSAEQLREKLRNLRRVFAEAKCGQHLGHVWEYFQEMTFLYDSDVEPHAEIDAPVEEEKEEDDVSSNPGTAKEVEHIDAGHSPLPLASHQSSSNVRNSIQTSGHNSSAAIHDVHSNGANTPTMENPVAEDGVNSIVQGLGNEALNISCSLSETAFVRNIATKSTPEWWRSPSKKVSAKSPTGLASNLKSPHTTPRKTPKRKIASINWPANVTEFFLNLCVERKECTQLDTVPIRIWKEISEVMFNEGHANCDWQTCRAKFNSLNAFFLEPLLDLRGVMSGVKWPHFDFFLQIHDIPPDYEAPDIASLGGNTPSKKGNHMWNDTAVQLLLSLYKEKRHIFKSSKSSIRHDILYREIANTMNHFDVPVSSKQCRSEFARLEGVFRQEYDKQKKTGQAPSSWKWYNVFLQMEDGSANLEPPVAFSVGTSTAYSEAGKQPMPSQRKTRTRSVTNHKNNASTLEEENVDDHSMSKKDVKCKKKAVYRSWQRDFQEAQLASRQAMVDELKQMRVEQDRRSGERLAAFKLIANQLLAIAEVTASQNKAPIDTSVQVDLTDDSVLGS